MFFASIYVHAVLFVYLQVGDFVCVCARMCLCVRLIGSVSFAEMCKSCRFVNSEPIDGALKSCVLLYWKTATVFAVCIGWRYR